jgi:hypothetical protein
MGASCNCILKRKEDIESQENFEENLKAVESIINTLNSQRFSHTGIWPNFNVLYFLILGIF